MLNSENMYDVVIVGGGPAGLSAAIYMARAKYKVLVAEKEKIGGQITITSEIVNYPGVEKTSGTELTQAMKAQAESFGAEFVMAEVLNMELEKDVKTIYTTAGEYKALGVVLATGANPRKLGFKGEKRFQGRGVAYCATCDGEFFTNMEIFVIGGGFAAVEEGIFLTKYGRKVTMIVREEQFTCARTVSDKIWDEEKIEVKFHTEIVEVGGDGVVSFARFRDNKTGEEWIHKSEKGEGIGVFVFAGYVPNTKWLNGAVECNSQGYLITDENQKTSVEGVYGAGDVCVKNLRQVVTAVSDGATAATSLEKHVSQIHEKLNIPEFHIEREKPKKEKDSVVEEPSESNGFLSEEIRQQLQTLFSKFEGKAVIKGELDDSPLAGEMDNFLKEIEEVTDKVIYIRHQVEGEEKKRREAEGQLFPAFILQREGQEEGNILFHGVPGGHEFNSFIIALYNVAGPGQGIDQGLKQRLISINKKINVKVLVSLSCTMCPEVVMAVQKAASISPNITGEMIDLMHYPELKSKYKVMSVPCMIINNQDVYFGKKNLEEITGILEEKGIS